MKKNNKRENYALLVRETVRKLTVVVLLSLFCINSADASVFIKKDGKITIKKTDVTIQSVIKEIEQKSEYSFFINDNLFDVNRKVSINVVDATIEQALQALLKGTNYTFQIVKKQIIIKKKTSPTEKKKKVTGRIVDAKGEALIGVTVKIKGENGGTITDLDGNFTIEADNMDKIEASYIGYMPQEVKVGSTNNLQIKLDENIKELQEIVVVGYGTQKRLNVTGALSSVSASQLKQSPVANISNALAGRLPGIVSVQRGGEPGNDGTAIWIRGFGTYGTANSPLVMVDGLERSYDNIDANEIEDITILKDASSTAIYGVRGANGVILITTKRGTAEKPQISVNLQSAIQQPTRLPEYLDSYDALKLYREGLINDGLNAAMYTDEYIAKYRDRSNPTYQYLYPNVNWQKEILKPYSLLHQANININGKNSFVRYFVSVSYMQQNGLYKYDDITEDYDIQAKLNRYNFRSNVDLSISKNLDMEVNLGGIIRDRNYPNVSTGDLWNRLKITPSWWYPVKNPDGSASGVQGLARNPYAMLTQQGYQRCFESTLQATAGFTWRLPWITEGLSVKGRLSFDSLNYRDVTRAKGAYTYRFMTDENETDLSKGTYTRVEEGTNTLDYAVNANGNKKVVMELFFNYDRKFGKHDVKGLLLYNQESYTEAVGGGRNNAIAGLPYKYQGLVGRAAYSFNDKYFAEFNFGYNGSENFMKGRRFGFFPAVSVGWLVSNEEFIQEKAPVISLLKLRASAGVVGNDKSGQRFLYQGKWILDGPGYQFGKDHDGAGYGGAQESATGNEYVTWEQAKKFNIGLDFGLWKNELKLELDAFYERRDHILTQPLTIPDMIGIENLPMINAGIVDNKGFEAVLTYQKSFRNFGYFIRGNYSFARNKIIDITEPKLEGREWQARTGRRINEHMGLTAIGLFKDQDDIASSPYQTFGPVQPGDIKYADLNGDGQIDSQDEGYLGRVSVPEAMAGLSVGFNYKGFDISVLFQGAFGAHVYYGGSSTYPFSQNSSVLAEVKGNYFTAENPNVNALYPRMTSNDNANNYRVSNYWHRKSDYVRLKNVEIGYTFPTVLMKKVGVSQARIYLTGLNLCTWSAIKTFDPEIPDGTGSYPQQRIFNMGLNFSF